jgi:2-oxoglutarate ferredoxin oxidoreductase subunit beta
VAEVRVLQGLIQEGIEHSGFSFIEAVFPCPAEYGKRNAPSGVCEMLDDELARSVPAEEASLREPDELEGKIITGVLRKETGRPEFLRSYTAIVERAQAEAREQVAREEAG